LAYPLLLIIVKRKIQSESEDIMEKNAEKRKVVDKRSIKLEDILKPDYIPFLEGRPTREKRIGSDDLIDLEIMIKTTTTVDEFLSKI
jgi:hypothetical protein